MNQTKKLKIRDLTLRDGQQSLFATRMTQQTIDRLLPLYENAGFYIMECWGGAVPDSVMRYLDESPWNRLRKVSEAMKGRSLLSALRLINKLGGIADGAVCYTVDPTEEAPAPEKKGFFARLFGKSSAAPAPEKIFTDEYFVEKAKEMEALGAKIITLKDMAGLVNPMRAASIISKLKSSVSVPVDFHTHCTPGYGLASAVMAILNGVDILDTNIWWFGGGSAAPAIELIYIFCQRMGVEIECNMEAVGAIRNELLSARQELKDFDLAPMPVAFDPLNDTLPAEVSARFDRAIECAKAGDEEGLLAECHAIEAHFGFPKPNELVKNAEVPGGMYSNMVAQLKALKAEDLLNDAMALIPKVRRDAGLVPLVTPTSQIVGSQAVSLALDRKNGHTPVPVDPAFREKITGDAAEHAYDVTSYKKPENPVLEDLGGVKLASNDEEYLLLELLPSVANGFLRRRRTEEFEAAQAEKAAAAKAAAPAEAEVKDVAPVTGPTLNAPMGGRIITVNVKAGDAVKKGEVLLVYEAMKMENDVAAERDSVVKRVFVKPDQVVGTDAVLIEFED